MSWHQWLIVHLSQETGTSSASSRAYQFWSGFGSDIGEVAIIGGLVGIFRQHTCHTKHCYRIAKHPVEGTPYKVCRKCHPTIGNKAPTRAEIHSAHREAQS
jgi:hypothetical protein